MTTTAQGEWRIDESTNYKVHNYTNDGVWANVIQDGMNDSYGYMVYGRDGHNIDGDDGMSEDDAKRRAQEAVDAIVREDAEQDAEIKAELEAEIEREQGAIRMLGYDWFRPEWKGNRRERMRRYYERKLANAEGLYNEAIENGWF